MQSKRFLPKIFLISGFLALFFIVKYQNEIKEISSLNLEKLKIYFDNFFYLVSPKLERQKPISFLEREEKLKAYIGQPFTGFDKSDWDKFWNIIYGAFPIEQSEKPGLPKKMRQLTLDEIAFELIARYPEPLAYFKEEHWKIFFGIILNK